MILNIDFSALEEALKKMGAKPVVIPNPEPVRAIDSIDIELEEGILLPGLKHIKITNGILSYKGRQILLYIQDHGGKAKDALVEGQKGNKFHVADCNTLQGMRAKGRYERYVVTNRLEGDFFITGFDWQTRKPVEGKTYLRVCQNCLKALNYKNAAYGNTRQLAQEFDIGAFFSSYSSFFAHLPQRWAGNSKEEHYTPDWAEFAARVKAERNFKCESCGVDLGKHRHLLHLHHKNGVKGDNELLNLSVLCAACHRDQAQHEHLFVQHADMQLINRLRTEQGQLQVTNWDKVFEYCDPALHGFLGACRHQGAVRPDIGLDIQNTKGAIVANLEVAWPRSKVGIAISEQDREAAIAAGWHVWELMKAMEDSRTFVAEANGEKIEKIGHFRNP